MRDNVVFFSRGDGVGDSCACSLGSPSRGLIFQRRRARTFPDCCLLPFSTVNGYLLPSAWVIAISCRVF